MPMAKPRIALIHDYLREYGGAERVLEALHDLYPDAPVYTAFFDRVSLGVHADRFAGWDIRETRMTWLPFYRQLHSPYRICAPFFFKMLDLRAFDCVISSTNAYYAKAVEVPHGVHICYCHTPPRALYGYTTVSDWKKNPLIRILGEVSNHFLRIVDFALAQKVDHFIANSQETARRIKKFYNRESTVIHPPVQVSEYAPKEQVRSYFLYVNRLALAKHPELAVAVCTQENLPLKVVGEGRMRAELESMAGPTITFLGGVSDAELAHLYQGAQALLYPVEDEDFGIVPVEAMGWGVPVIAHNSGGPKETIKDGVTGVLFNELSVSALSQALHHARTKQFSVQTLHEHARSFAVPVFKKKIAAFVRKAMKE